jgi:hypothetical protein
MARVSRYFNQQDWIETTTGSGVTTFADGGKTVTLDAPASSRSFLLNTVIAWPGDSFEFSVMAQNVDTSKSGFAEIFIDSPSGTRRTEIRVEAETMTSYTLRYDVPPLASGPRQIIFGIGSDFATDGSARYMLPRIDKVKGDDSFLYGVFRVASGGGMTVLNSVKSFNIVNAGITWDATNIWYKVTPTETTSTLFTDGSNDFKPSLIAKADAANSAATPTSIDWNISGLGDDGSFNVQAVNGQTGVRIDLSAGIGKNLDIAAKIELL